MYSILGFRVWCLCSWHLWAHNQQMLHLQMRNGKLVAGRRSVAFLVWRWGSSGECVTYMTVFPVTLQVHGIGGAAGVLWYALMAKKELVTGLYGEDFAMLCAA